MQRLQAEAALLEAKTNLYSNPVALAERYWYSSNVRQAEQQLAKCPADLRHWEWHYLKTDKGRSLFPLGIRNDPLSFSGERVR